MSHQPNNNNNNENNDRFVINDMFQSVAMAAPPPPRMIGGPTSVKAQQKSAVRQVQDQQQKQQNNIKPFVWSIQVVKPIPSIYPPLDRNAIVITDISLDDLTARISGFMRFNSISCSYEDDRVAAVTQTLVKFVVQLWRKADNSLIVEVQRRQGCSIEMQRVRKTLFQCCTSTDGQPTKVESCTSFHRPVPAIPMSFIQEQEKNKDKETEEAVGFCLDMLESPRFDQNCLGLESLSILTDATKVQPTCAKQVSHALLFAEGSQGSGLQNALEGFLIRDTGYGRDQAETSLLWFNIQVMALKVLSNALNNCMQETSSLQAAQNPFWQTTYLALVRHLERVESHPQAAALSANCLRVLEILKKKDTSTSFSPSPQRLSVLALDAHQYGRAYHSNLEKESQLLLGCYVE